MAASKARKVLVAALSAATLVGAVAVTETPAQAAEGYYRGRAYAAPYYRPRRNVGGAVAAGVVGGLALGALAATAARPAYAAPVYGAPVYGAAPVYGEDCYVVRRRVVNEWGDVVVRRTQVCE